MRIYYNSENVPSQRKAYSIKETVINERNTDEG